MHKNFIVANYAADGGCLDNDDGSSYYQIHHNFCVFGGHKSDFDGNSKISSFNLHAYPSVYGAKCLGILAQLLPPKGYAEGYNNNVCILGDAGDPYLDVGGVVGANCLESPAAKQLFEDGLLLSNNTVGADGNLDLIIFVVVDYNCCSIIHILLFYPFDFGRVRVREREKEKEKEGGRGRESFSYAVTPLLLS